MKRSISLVAIAALFAIGAAFTTRQGATWWNVTNPSSGSPGIYFLNATQIKAAFCPGVNNLTCAYMISNPSVIVKRP